MKSIMIRQDVYDAIEAQMLDVLDKVEEMSSESLFGALHQHFVGKFGENVGWYLFQVKRDLEVRGLIKCEYIRIGKKPKSLIRVARKGLKQLKDRTKLKLPASQQVGNTSENVKSKFIELYKTLPLLVQSPGTINLIGEHTDYNDGFAMPAAIDKGVSVAIAPSEHDHSLLYSLKYDQFFSFSQSEGARVTSPHWANYFLGIIFQLKGRGHQLSNFNCAFDGTLPVEAGLSSSAALGCAFVFALNELFDLRLSRLEMIHLAQSSEHAFAQVRCGIMDQYASMASKKNHAMLLDCKWLKHEYVPLNLGQYKFVLCDTNIKRSLVSSKYNIRREECERAVRIFQQYYPEIDSIRDVSIQMIRDHKSNLGMTLLRRCMYVVHENVRVLKCVENLRNGKLVSFGRKMFQSHAGLSSMFEVSCPELDFLVGMAKGNSAVLGAKMIGGGFGGCTLNLIREDAIDGFLDSLKTAYRAQFGIEMNSYFVKTANGTSVVL
jgi:galactokinase